MVAFLEFEKPVAELEARVAELRAEGSPEARAEANRLAERAERQLADIYSRLTPWQKTIVARHAERPHFKDYVAALIEDFTPLSGDRKFAEDAAIVGGIGRLKGRSVMVIGHEKGSDTASRVKHNFGMGRPEGYRKAVRLMEMAARFGLPVVTLVDTPGAFPGIDAEERGQAEAIARATAACLDLDVPMVAAIVGEGGSGGAVALATANRIVMFEHAVYAVISPEGCASILWRGDNRAADGAPAPAGPSRAAEAAEAMKVTASDLKKLGVIDRIIYEPRGGAHRDPATAIQRLGTAISAELTALETQSPAALRSGRRAKFLAMGRVG
ncbi:acetyl-CoA carboxylase carboxyltransferase subunit alpha [Polymorphobacter megasporae]|uniref:acetyl-CoA carboxylase carboxyltransferase subunit alpha n=1 Tax=Glacieibacterium megasporae TaxID=2835787 RepID=UPI001C1E0EED|nr:acetyl-CoA carboxylase carboxyltransferase subunit alpha [Polymorphobacter megasporae]UAJ11605.1 acetyl-CoA carboxylase carboxyltransferase subunit alpha [Polymorphobacter megasporae]